MMNGFKSRKIVSLIAVLVLVCALLSGCKKNGYGNFKVVKMGNYGGEEIEWLVLKDDGDTKTLITAKGQDAVMYNASDEVENDYELSEMRTWLNDTFYNAAFSDADKAKIVPGPTNENVCLLSVDEAKEYFKNDEERQSKPTSFAEKNGAWANEETGTGWWWLRTPSKERYNAAGVSDQGQVYPYGYYMNDFYLMARPVIVIKAE